MTLKYHREIADKVRALGVEAVVIEDARKHKRLRGRINGREFCYSMASSPSDWRVPRKILADIRRMIRAE